MNFARKIKVNVTQEQAQILDGQSKICNWLYNYLFDQVEEDNKNGKPKKLLSGYNLRNMVPQSKEEYPFLKSVFSSPTKNVALRLKEAYTDYFKGLVEHPHHRSWKKKWFSLLYEEPFKGYGIDKKTLTLSLGKDERNKQICLKLELADTLTYREADRVVSLRITKDRKHYYAVFTLDRSDVVKEISQERWISFDPNHKNLMVGIDNNGYSIEFERTDTMKYWDKRIDKLKSKRDKCKKKSVFVQKEEGKGRGYWKPSRKWERYNNALEKAYACQREQNKQEVYSLANVLVKHYDRIIIGDYAPSTETAKYNNQHRSMLNQTYIGKIRNIFKWVAMRSGKVCSVVDEYHTTKECPFCGHMEHKEPEIRVYTCPQCGTTYYRDIGSAINIAVRDKKLLRSDYLGWKVNRPEYTAHWNWRHCRWLISDFDVDEGNESDFSLKMSMHKFVHNNS